MEQALATIEATPLPQETTLFPANIADSKFLYKITDKQVRLSRLTYYYNLLHKIVEERQEAYNQVDEPGVSTGLLVHNPKDDTWRLDTPLLTELRNLEQRAAEEMGEWQNNAPPSYVKVEIVNVTPR